MRWSKTPWIQGIYLQWKCATAAIPKRLDSTFVFRSQSHWSFSRRMLSTAPHSIFTICSPHLCTTGFVVIQQSSTDHSLLALHKVITDRCVITCRCAAPEGGKSPLRPATAQKPSLPDTHTHMNTHTGTTDEWGRELQQGQTNYDRNCATVRNMDFKKKSLKIKKMFGQFYLFAKPQKFFSLN